MINSNTNQDREKIKNLFEQLIEEENDWLPTNEENIKYFWNFIKYGRKINFFSPFCLKNDTDNSFRLDENFRIQQLTNLFTYDFKLKNEINKYIWDSELILKTSIIKMFTQKNILHYKVKDLFKKENSEEYWEIFNFNPLILNKFSIFTSNDKTILENLNKFTFGNYKYLFLCFTQEIQIEVIKNIDCFKTLFNYPENFSNKNIIDFFIIIYEKIIVLRNSTEHVDSVFDFKWDEWKTGSIQQCSEIIHELDFSTSRNKVEEMYKKIVDSEVIEFINGDRTKIYFNIFEILSFIVYLKEMQKALSENRKRQLPYAKLMIPMRDNNGAILEDSILNKLINSEFNRLLIPNKIPRSFYNDKRKMIPISSEVRNNINRKLFNSN